MGHTYQYRCSHCGFEQKFNHGHGYHTHSQPLAEYLKQPQKSFHYKTDQVLNRLAKKDHTLFLQACFRVYKCPMCKILFDKSDVIVYKEDEEIHKSEFRCSKCRSRLKLTNIHRLKRANCPKCGKRTFHIQPINTLWKS